jgi:hypothetical protein
MEKCLGSKREEQTVKGTTKDEKTTKISGERRKKPQTSGLLADLGIEERSLPHGYTVLCTRRKNAWKEGIERREGLVESRLHRHTLERKRALALFFSLRCNAHAHTVSKD